jgi:hypothetical protein
MNTQTLHPKFRSVVLAGLALVAAGVVLGQESTNSNPGTEESVDALNSHKPARAAEQKEQAGPMARLLLSPPPPARLDPIRDQVPPPMRTPRGNHVNGRTRKLDATTIAGAWERLPAGNRVWRVAIQSPGAVALRVHFTAFDSGSGKVWIYPQNGESGSPGVGPYTAQGIHQNGDFWSGVVFSDTVVVEYDAASTVDTSGTVPFTISEIAHIASLRSSSRGDIAYSTVDHTPARTAGNPQSSSFRDSRILSAPLSCEVDVSCASDLWRVMARSVGLYLAFEGDYVIACTGTLMNNKQQNFRPYFLTANHCVGDNQTAQSSIVLWDFQSSFCNGYIPDPTTLPQQPVDRLLVTQPIAQGDFSLLLLQG